ncbi:MAG TPA: hypothetical protein VGM27_01705 [Acidobacteriaceae bacterium]|jgi:hypothetical protein
MDVLLTMALSVAISKLDNATDHRLERPQAKAMSAPDNPIEDDAAGVCAAFSHFHSYDPSDPLLDGRCHADDDDRVVSSSSSEVFPSPAIR